MTRGRKTRGRIGAQRRAGAAVRGARRRRLRRAKRVALVAGAVKARKTRANGRRAAAMEIAEARQMKGAKRMRR